MKSVSSWTGIVTTVLGLLALGVVNSVSAVPPDQRLPGNQGPVTESVPTAGYHRTVELLRLRRQAEIPGLALSPGLNLRLGGTRSVPVVCVEFANRPHNFDINAYQNMLFDPPGPAPSPARQTFTQYYRDVSNGQFVPTGKALGWYSLPQNDDFYELTNNGLNERMPQLLEFGFQKADAEVDFGEFDNDGPDGLPNSGDDDGIVDTIFVIHSETGGECGPQGVNRNVWSHSFQFSGFATTSGPFVTNDVRRNALGEPVLGANSKIRIDDYTVQPALNCGSTTAAPQIIPIGVFCHEYGHALGLPDLYDRTPDNGADSAGIGNYCLMAGGSYGAKSNNAARPVEMSAWCKATLGWATLRDINGDDDIALEPVQARNLIYNIDVPGTNGELSNDQLRQRLSGELHVSPQRIQVGSQCIHLVDGDPQKARIVAHAEVAVGENSTPIEVFIDGETGQVLEMK